MKKRAWTSILLSSIAVSILSLAGPVPAPYQGVALASARHTVIAPYIITCPPPFGKSCHSSL